MIEKLRRFSKRIASDADGKQVFDSAVDLAVESTGAERGLLVLQKGKKLVVQSARNVDQESLRGREARMSLTIARQAMDEATTLLVDDAGKQDLFSSSESVFELGLRSVLCVPVWNQGEIMGALYLDSRFIAGAFGSRDALTVEALADFLSIYLWKLANAEKTAELEARLAQSASKLESVQEQLDELNSLTVRAQNLKKSKGTRGQSPFPPMIGESPAIEKVYAIIEKVLDNDITILIQGESGTGKELVAKAIHQYGRRKDQTFVAINCSSIPGTLIESELFGHLKGSFTGATRDKKGLFEVADNGTLFLDEVGDMPMEMQGKLLRALQYGEVQRLGAVQTKTVNVRVVAATNRNLEELVARGAFREDLFYRLNIVSIEVPPLRRRKEDIPLLVQRFVEVNAVQGLSDVTGLTPQALLALTRYPWPGNVRELETVLKSACLFAERPLLDVDDFEALSRAEGILIEPGDPASFEGKTLAEIERDVILATLKLNDGNKKRTATVLGIDRRTLYNKLKLYGVM
jgi:transcriptional regulator with GAF, ATPase, and Fis domain